MHKISDTNLPVLKKSGNELLKERIIAIRTQLPRDWKRRLIELAPEYNSLEYAAFVNNVLRGKAFDVRLTELFEKIAQENQL